MQKGSSYKQSVAGYGLRLRDYLTQQLRTYQNLPPQCRSILLSLPRNSQIELVSKRREGWEWHDFWRG